MEGEENFILGFCCTSVKNDSCLNRMEDANDAISMIFQGGQHWLLGWCIGFIVSVAILNYAGGFN